MAILASGLALIAAFTSLKSRSLNSCDSTKMAMTIMAKLMMRPSRAGMRLSESRVKTSRTRNSIRPSLILAYDYQMLSVTARDSDGVLHTLLVEGAACGGSNRVKPAKLD